MGFDSLGIGEIGIVLVLLIVLVNPKHLGKIMRTFADIQRKIRNLQSDFRNQIDNLVMTQETGVESVVDSKRVLRKSSKERIGKITAEHKARAAEDALVLFGSWERYQKADSIAAFVSRLDEMDTMPLLKRILADGKKLYLPYVIEEKQGEAPVFKMAMTPITNLEEDITEGTYGIQEPKLHLRNKDVPESFDLILIPGLCFDSNGGRLGRGKGFYDRFLKDHEGWKCGFCHDFQIREEALRLEEFDIAMNSILTDKRILSITAFEYPNK